MQTQIGLLHQHLNRFDQAETNLLLSLQSFEEIGDLHEQAYSHYYLFKLYSLMNESNNKTQARAKAEELGNRLGDGILLDLLVE